MKKNIRRFDDTGEIIFDTIDIDEFADANDYDENGAGFANADDFDDEKSRFTDEDDYEDEPGIYGGVSSEEYVEESDGYTSEDMTASEDYYEDNSGALVAGETAVFDEAGDPDSDDDLEGADNFVEADDLDEAADLVEVTDLEEADADESDEIILEYIEDGEDEKGRRTNKAVEKLMIVLAACAVIGLVIFGVGTLIMKNRASVQGGTVNENGLVYNAELGGAGLQLDGIDVIGGSGIRAALEKKKGMETDEFIETDEFDEPYEEDVYEEIDYQNDIEIALETVSVVKDLKIKVINKKTGKLIANIPFVIKATTPSGTVLTWADSDKDGIIYCADIAAGNYSLHLEGLDSEKYAGYIIPADVKSTVKAEIAYEKVDVSGEILAAGDVDEATEDTARDGAGADGGTMANTVAWVESTKTEAGYTALPSNAVINRPFEIAGLGYGDSITIVTTGEVGNPGEGGDPGNGEGGEPGQTAPTGSITLGAESVALAVNESRTVDVTVTGPDTAVMSITINNTAVASAIYSKDSKNVTIKGISGGTATVTLELRDGDGGPVLSTKSISVTVTKGTVTISRTALGVLAGGSASAEVTLSGMNAADVTVNSSASGVATAALDADGKKLVVTGVAAGTANITVTQTADPSVTATLAVTVYAGNEKLTATIDTKTVQVYVKDASGNYKEATYADYSATAVFYYAAEAKYTGWQTIDGKTYYYTADGKAVTGEQVINGVLYNFDSTGAMVVGSGTLGIDVSKWNGTINWSKVKAAGVSYAIIRVGYRGSTLGGLIDDANFKKNIEGANAAGIKVGVYFVTQAVNDAEAVYEASMVLDRISKYKISYPVFLDVEASGGRGDKIDVATRTSVCKTFCRTIQNAGYTAGIYANKSWLTTMIDTSQLTGYKIWCAQYYTKCTYTGHYDIWQYSESGTIDGISGKVDLNKSYLGY